MLGFFLKQCKCFYDNMINSNLHKFSNEIYVDMSGNNLLQKTSHLNSGGVGFQ